jgi:hypothetical protein
VTDSKPETVDGGSTPPDSGDKPRTGPGPFAILGLLVGIAAVVVAPLLPTSARHISASLLIFAGITLIVVWAFSHITEAQVFGKVMTAVVITALLCAGGYLLLVSPVKPTAATVIREPTLPPKPPKLYFEQGSSARVPYCTAYTILAKGPVPAGYQLVVFDAPIDIYGNVTGHYNFDQVPTPDPNVPGKFVDPAITVGSQSRTAGFRAVVIAAIIADKEAGILEAVTASAAWKLRNLPDVLATQKLKVTRTSTDSSC